MEKQYLTIDCLADAIKKSDFFDEALLLEETESSNDYAKNIIENNQNYRSGIICVNKQTKGRGRQNKVWISEHGLALTCSLVFDAKDLFLPNYTSLLAAKALHKALMSFAEIEHSDNKLTIKWPNDIYAGEKKIAGILTENIYQKDKLQKQVLGIGLNVASENFTSAELKNAGSIKTVYNFMPSLKDLFLKICHSIETTFIEKKFDHEYINIYSFLKDKTVVSIQNNTSITGIALGINHQGELLLALDNNSIKKINAGSIELF